MQIERIRTSGVRVRGVSGEKKVVVRGRPMEGQTGAFGALNTLVDLRRAAGYVCLYVFVLWMDEEGAGCFFRPSGVRIRPCRYQFAVTSSNVSLVFVAVVAVTHALPET